MLLLIKKGRMVHGCGGSIASLQKCNQNISANFRSRKSISYFKILITQRTCITYNENIVSFNVIKIPVILPLDTGVFSSNMQEAI
jgi:hypothetical protein